MRYAALALCLGIVGCSVNVHISHPSELRMDTKGSDLVIQRGDRTVILHGGAALGHMEVKEEELEVEEGQEPQSRVTVEFASSRKTFLWDKDSVAFAGHSYALDRPGTWELDAEGNLVAPPK